MTTYGDIIAKYADLVTAKHADVELTHQQRAYVTALLRAESHNAQFVDYPPTPDQRATARMHVTGMVASSADIAPTDYAEWDAAVTRVLEIVTHA